ncbi:hypothetical protein KJN74_04425 [Candidatus Bathyarchaeota archaeon]|nr:hypothetical protein [Candidatus Bathyarchaeota archaeon]
MKRFTTNMALRYSFNSTKKQIEIGEPVILSKEIQKKIRLIKKAFR